MKQLLTSERTVVIHDFDGVHYHYGDHPDIYTFFGGVNAQAVVSMFPQLELEQAKAIAVESYRQYHNGYQGFTLFAEELGWDTEEFKFRHSKEYHRLVYQALLAEYPDYIKPCVETLALFDALKGNVRHCLLTQSDMEHWAGPLLKWLGYDSYFDQNGLLGFEECNGHYKAQSPYPVELALSKMRVQAGQAAFIEDALVNLKVAKEVGPIYTVYVHHGVPLDILPDYVDAQVAKPRDFLRVLRDLHAKPAPDNTPGNVIRVLPSLDPACK